ncbi:hypothetical protein BVX99_01845 [bacterium F16]|nr:hypothetical protein BVX99_01845 [bacterium F16]
MSSRKDYFKHDARCLFMQVLFLFVYVFFLTNGYLGKTLAPDFYFYLGTIIGWFCISLLIFGLFFKFPRTRHFLTVVAMMVNAFIIPRAVLACGPRPEIVALTGSMYVVAIIIVASNDVAFAAFVASVAFAFYFHGNLTNFLPEKTQSEYFKIGLTYMGLIVIALGWRAAITRLYSLVKHLPMPGQVSEDAYEMVENENSILRNKVAKIIINIQKLTGTEQQPNSGNEQ